MIPIAVPNLAGNEARYLRECIETNYVSSVGPFVDRFETLVAKAAGAAHGVATSSGTTGLHAALTALGVGRDDLVILPSFTFIASANAIAHCGAAPWLMDVQPDSWTLDPRRVVEALDRETRRSGDALIHQASGRRVAAMMPVYTLGLPAQMDALIEIAQDRSIPVVADAAAALGATYQGRPVGGLGAELTVFSFNGNKTVTAGGGGLVAGSDEALCAAVRHLTTTARSSKEYDHDRVGFNYRMTNLQAAVGCAQLEVLDDFVAAKRRIARGYDRALAGIPGVGCFPAPDWAESACWLSGITLKERAVSEVVPELRKAGIDARPFWKPIHLQLPYAKAPCEEVPVTTAVWSSVLTLPCSTDLQEDLQDEVISSVRAALG